MNRLLRLLLLSLLSLASCAKESSLHFHSKQVDALAAQKKTEEIQAQIKKKSEAKKQAWQEIVTEANESFESIKPIIQTKCFACHDANTKLPVYGRIFRNHNPINAHQVNGLKALDFSKGFPLSAQGNPPQLSLLKSIKAAATDRTMPIKMFRVIYPRKKIFDEDEKLILSWVDPLIEKIEDYNKTYETFSGLQILEQKCYRCHANGNSRGGFSGLELMTKKQIASSKIFQLMSDGKMPLDKREAATQEELQIVRDWLEDSTKE
jgi:cytochrome c5